MPEIRLKGKIMIEKRVTAIGSGAHVLVPKTWIGSTVKIILLEKETNGKIGN